MARKLLMNGSGLSPVMDGLICWLDGRDCKTGDTVWKDRIGNNIVSISNRITFSNGLVLLDYPENRIKITNSITAMSFYIQANPHSGSYLLDARPSKPSGYMPLADIGGVGGDFNKNRLFADSIKLASSVTKLPIGKESYYFEFNKAEPCTGICLFSKNSGMESFLGKASSVFIYNRALTDEEIKQNYEYEKSIERGVN